MSSNAYSIMVKLNFSSVFFILATAAALVFALPVPDENTSDVQAKYVVPLHAHLTHHLTLLTSTPEGNIYNVATHLFISSDGAPGKKVVSSPHQKGVRYCVYPSLVGSPDCIAESRIRSSAHGTRLCRLCQKQGRVIHPPRTWSTVTYLMIGI